MINRFYTPSLPQYTSQFVEDRTPWGEMLALEQTKIDRTERAEQALAETDALVSSLMPGPQTIGLAQRTADKYRERIKKIIEDNKHQMSSIPAMREITKVNADFRNDQQIKKIQLDRENTPWYQKMRSNPMYPLMIDPNIDPEIGGVRQLTEEDEYRDMATPFDINTYIDQYYSDIKERQPSTSYIETLKDKETEMEITGVRNLTKRILGKEDFDEVRPQLVNTLKQLAGEGYSEEDILNRVMNLERKRYVNQDIQNTFSPYKEGTGSGTDKNKTRVTNLETPNYEQYIRNNTPASGINMSDPNKVQRFLKEENERIAYTAGDLYDIVKDDPEKMLRLTEFEATHAKYSKPYVPQDGAVAALYNTYNAAREAVVATAGLANQLTSPNLIRRAMIKTRAAEDPYGTEQMFKEYFDEQRLLPSLKSKVGMGEEDRVMGWINDVKKSLGVDEEPFDNVFNRDRAINAAIRYGDFENAPFKNIQEMISTPMDQFTPAQNYWLKTQNLKGGKEAVKEIGVLDVEGYDKETSEKIMWDIFGFEPDANGKIPASTASAKLRGRTVVPVGKNFEDQLEEKEVNKLIKEDSSISYMGRIKPGNLRYGDGFHVFSIDGEDYIVSGDKDEVNAFKLYSNAYSYEKPENMGLGDVFAIAGVNPSEAGGLSVNIIDAQNKGKESTPSDAVYMSIDAVNQLTDEGRINDYYKKLNIFQADVSNKDIDSRYLNPYSKDNPDGYLSFSLPVMPDGRIHPIEVEYNVKMGYYQLQHLRGKDVKKQIEALNMLYMNDLVNN